MLDIKLCLVSEYQRHEIERVIGVRRNFQGTLPETFCILRHLQTEILAIEFYQHLANFLYLTMASPKQIFPFSGAAFSSFYSKLQPPQLLLHIHGQSS